MEHHIVKFDSPLAGLDRSTACDRTSIVALSCIVRPALLTQLAVQPPGLAQAMCPARSHMLLAVNRECEQQCRSLTYWMSQAHRADVRVGLATIQAFAVAKRLGMRLQLHVRLYANDRFIPCSLCYRDTVVRDGISVSRYNRAPHAHLLS